MKQHASKSHVPFGS